MTIGHFLFTKLLIPALLAGKETSPDKHARVISTSSSGAYFYTLNFDTFKDGPARKKLGTQRLYAQSKFVRYVGNYMDLYNLTIHRIGQCYLRS